MELVIQNDDQMSSQFISYLLNVIRSTIMEQIQDYLKFNFMFSKYDSIINVQTIMSLAAQNFKSYIFQDKIIIKIDPLVNYLNTQFKLITLCKFLNYGDLEIPGCHVFSNILNSIVTQLNDIYSEYTTRG